MTLFILAMHRNAAEETARNLKVKNRRDWCFIQGFEDADRQTMGRQNPIFVLGNGWHLNPEYLRDSIFRLFDKMRATIHPYEEENYRPVTSKFGPIGDGVIPSGGPSSPYMYVGTNIGGMYKIPNMRKK